MIQRESKKQHLAKQLGVSIRVLEQYLQVKRAEVMQQPAPVTPKIERISLRMSHDNHGGDYGGGKGF